MDENFGPEEQILWPASVLAGVVVCGVVYEITRKVSSWCFKDYDRLSPMQKVEWNNRGFSTFHALVVAAVSFYLVVISDLFNEDVHNTIIIDRKSWLSDAMFGVSIGYFLTDLVMILWYFPSLGGKEYLLHHGLSMYAICLALLSGKAHMYILMVLFTEATTPFVNLRWYLDVAGQKSCNLYLFNGLALFVGWLVARIILFIYFFTHMYFHFDQDATTTSPCGTASSTSTTSSPIGLSADARPYYPIGSSYIYMPWCYVHIPWYYVYKPWCYYMCQAGYVLVRSVRNQPDSTNFKWA